uniref:Uncharacterized protein n=1 Tax=Podarcis muralis TaxID=64176 RepID=A0A670IN46_PODMU
IPLRGVGHPRQLFLGAALEVIPALLHLLPGPLPAGDAVDLGGDALPHPPPLGHRHPPALGAVQLGVVGTDLLDQDLVLLVGEAGLAEAGDLLALARHPGRGAGAPQRLLGNQKQWPPPPHISGGDAGARRPLNIL